MDAAHLTQVIGLVAVATATGRFVLTSFARAGEGVIGVFGKPHRGDDGRPEPGRPFDAWWEIRRPPCVGEGKAAIVDLDEPGRIGGSVNRALVVAPQRVAPISICVRRIGD